MSHPVPNFAWSNEHPLDTGHDFKFTDRGHAYPLEPLVSLRNPVVLAGRLWAWCRAASGWFWSPCPLCGLFTGGHEWRDGRGHVNSVPTGECGRSHGICQWCTRAGRGWDDMSVLGGAP
jgi:hypothetical protein